MQRANVNPAAIAALANNWQEEGANLRQAGLDAVRAIFQNYVMIPALKAAIAHFGDDGEWNRLRPPLVELNETVRRTLIGALQEAGFLMPGLHRDSGS